MPTDFGDNFNVLSAPSKNDKFDSDLNIIEVMNIEYELVF